MRSSASNLITHCHLESSSSHSNRGSLFVISRLLILLLGPAALLSHPTRASADVSTEIAFPATLTLSEALRMLRTKGLDVLIAEAQVRGAEGDVHAAGAVPNPTVAFAYGRVFNYAPGPGQDDNQYTAGLADQAALTDTLWGKRGLRLRVARAALAAARLERLDAVRVLEFQVKQQYAELAQGMEVARFSRDVAAAASTMLDLSRRRYPQVIDAGALARIETQKLEADQALD
jgi:cobalt-zinc-cadmium efflux system outer membrane protein